MASFDFDLAIIGGGSAGLTAAKVARFFDKRVVMIDQERLGGDCLHYGCVPSKALIKASRIAHEARTSERWGIHVDGVRPVDLGEVNARVQDAIDHIARLDSPDVLAEMGVEVKLGGARFVDDHTLRVGDDELVSAKYVLIATGSRPAPTRVPGLAEIGFDTNESIFDLTDLPARLAVIGGGPIGVEMGQAFRRLGSQVTIIQRAASLIPRDDLDCISVLETRFADEGIDVRLLTEVATASRDGDDVVLSLVGEHGGEVRVDRVLVAVGRTPNLEELDLDAAGVDHDDRHIPVNDRFQTNKSHVYAAGDIIGGHQFTHLAGFQAAHAARNIFLPLKSGFDPVPLPWVTFTDPEVAHVGITEVEAAEAGTDVTIVRFPYSHNERAVTDNEHDGLMKFLIDPKRHIVGCHIAGAHAGELINEITLAIKHGITVDGIVGTIHAYPTYSFGLPIALYDYVLNEHPSTIAKVGRFLSKLT